MSKILLIFPKLEKDKEFHYVPFGLLKVASKLLAEGHQVKILDQRTESNFMEKLFVDLMVHDEVMISSFTGYQLTQTYEIAKFIKECRNDIKITLGGTHATILPELTLKCEYIDDVFIGYYETGEYEIRWDLININDYINLTTKRAIYISSYSCPGVCTFCATIPRQKLVFIPLEMIEKDIDNLMKIYPFKEIVFFDSTIFTIPERAYFIADLMKKHNLKWIADARADEICRMPRYMLDEIVNSGLTQLTIGLESGSQQVVEKMKKGKNHLENYKKCAEILSNYDMKMCSGVIFGTPGETPEDIKQTIEYIKEIKKINPNFRLSTTFFMPLPNTEMCDEAKEYGYIEPQSLEEYAERGSDMHYNYNSYQQSMWINDSKEYKKIYDEFVKENKELFI